jgi:outer membrane receptor for ferrienterochelin and colicins
MDFHNLYGNKFTPRVHAKYDFTESLHLRANAGMGWRVANPLAENYGLLVSSRSVEVAPNLQPEISWNYGVSLSQMFEVWNNKASFVVDYYYTDFQNMLVVDMENHKKLRFYNLVGKAYANSLQAEVNVQPVKRMEVKLAYRYFDVQNDYQTEAGLLTRLQKQMMSRDRVLFNIGYATRWDKWKFDLTIHWNGARRVPPMFSEATKVLLPESQAPAFFNLNAQVTKQFKRWELYVGGENLTGFIQANPIMSAYNPFGPHFDAGMAWGPIIGRMVYTGMRWKM